MKRLCFVVVLMFLLVGCSSSDKDMNKVISFRQALLEGKGCDFKATVTADYGENIYSFTMQCTTDADGNMRFEVLQPETISGITGIVTEEDGKLTFDEHALLFDTIAEGQLTPVTAPWVFVDTLRGGYIRSCGRDGDTLRIQIDDSYADNLMQLDIWIDDAIRPIRGEILWDGRRILSIDVVDFSIL